MLPTSIGSLRFGDTVAAITPAGERIVGTLSYFFGTIGGKVRVGISRASSLPCIVPEIHTVDVDALRPLDARSGR